MSIAITQNTKNTFGKRRRGLLSTTAIVAAGVMIGGQAQAQTIDPYADWDGINIVSGSAGVTDTGLGSTQIDQHTMRAVGEAQELHIGTLGNVRINQTSSNALFVARAIGDHDDPTQILGTLTATGQVMILDRNGVIFGAGSHVDVAGVAVSTGEVSNADVMDGDGSFTFNNFGDGAIELRGTVSVADSGLAAFVSPTVINSGVINAKMGTVVMAAGEIVTLDLHGDGLVEVAVEGELGNALLETTGEINAEAGTVIMTASDAKDIVDNIINVDGVVDVSSVTQQGGKIILTGGNINIAESAQVKANNGGEVIAFADGKTQLDGKIYATGGFVETSGVEVGMGENALVTASQWLIDPLSILISNAVNPSFTNISAIALAASLSVGTNTTITTGVGSSVTGAPGDENAGDILVESALNVTNATDVTLRLEAHRNVEINADVTAAGAGALNLELIADHPGLTGDRDVIIRGDVKMNGGDLTAIASDGIAIRDGGSVDTDGGNISITSLGIGDATKGWLWMSGGAGGSLTTDGGDITVNVHDVNIAKNSFIDAGTGHVSIDREVGGTIGLGSATGDMTIDQGELERIDAGSLTIGGTNATKITVEDVNTTTGTIAGLVTLNTSNAFTGDEDVIFKGANVFNALEVNSDDDIVFDPSASVETLIGDASFFGDTNKGTVGNLEMGVGSLIDTNGNNIVVSALNVNMDKNSKMASEGGNINIEGRNDFLAGEGNVTLDTGALIDADGGNIVIDNEGIFFSVDKDSVTTHTTGTIDINQNDGGIIQNAIDAVENTGSGLNTIHVGAGTYNENVMVYEDNFLLEGINHGIDPNTGIRGPESFINGGIGGFGTAYGIKVTSNNVTIDGFQIEADGNGVFLDGGVGGTSKFVIQNNIITTINDTDGQDQGILGVNIDDVTVNNNHLSTIGNHGMQFKDVTNVNIFENVIDGAIDFDGINFGTALNDTSVVIRDNRIVMNTGDGIDSDGINFVGAINNTSVVIKDNTIVLPGDDGIDFDGAIGGTTTVDISGNTITAADDGVDINGIIDKATVTFADSASNVQSISGNNNGVEIKNLQSSNTVYFNGGTYSGNINGTLIDNTTTNSTNTGRVVLNNTTPLSFNGTAPAAKAFSALTDATGPGLDIDMQTSTAVFEDGEVGLYLSGVGIDLIGDTIGETFYKNNSKFFIQLADGAEFQPGTPTLLDGSNATFENAAITAILGVPGGVSGIDASVGGYTFAEINALAEVESKVHHYLDFEDLGLFSIIPDGFVGDPSLGLQGIQRMVNVASSGDTLLLGSGVYNDPSDTDEGFLPIEIYKSLTILGANHETGAHDTGRTAGSADEVVLDFAGATGAAGVSLSPAIIISADDVTLKGVDLNADSSNIAGIRLVDLDLAGALDNIDISNNFIHGADGTPIFGHGITTTNDLLAQDYTNLNIAGNNIFNVLGDGVHVDNAPSVLIDDNDIHDVGQNGVFVAHSLEATVSNNWIDDTGIDGVKIESSVDVDVVDNGIGTRSGAGNIGDDGVHISGSNGALVGGNTIQNTVGNGVHVNPSDDVEVSNNNISHVANNGVLVESGSSVDVLDNIISYTGLNGIRLDNHNNGYVYWNQISHAYNDGIQLNDSDNALVDMNVIEWVGGDGIESNGSNHLQVVHNYVHGADYDGIAINGGYDVKVDKNVVENVDSDGISSSASKVDITNNLIVAAWNGINVFGGNKIKIVDNEIKSIHNNGIQASYANNVTIKGNDISYVGNDGINAHEIGGDDLYGDFALRIKDNNIDYTGDDGIDVSDSGRTKIDENRIYFTGRDGYYDSYHDGYKGYVEKDDTYYGGHDISLEINYVGGDYDGADGIRVTNTGGGVSEKSYGAYDKGYGGYGYFNEEDSYGVIIKNNTVNHTGDDGIEVVGQEEIFELASFVSEESYGDYEEPIYGGAGNVLISGNNVSDAGYSEEDGVHTGQAYDGYGADGIHVRGIGQEIVPIFLFSESESFDEGYGYGYGDTPAVKIVENIVNVTGDDGIEVLDSGKTLIKNNTISYVGLDSYVHDYDFYTYLNNGDGIHVDNVHANGGGYALSGFGFGDYGSGYDVSIIDNNIHQTGDDGIDVGNSGRTLISGNNISDAGVGAVEEEPEEGGLYYQYGYGDEHGADGIFVHNVREGVIFDTLLAGFDGGGYQGYDVNILNNDINATGDDGIEVINSGTTYIAQNDIINTGVSGGYGLEIPSLSLEEDSYEGNDGGDLFGHGADGIHVRNVQGFGLIFAGDESEGKFEYYDVAIVGNDIDNTSDDGIEVVDSGRTLIKENKINNTGLIGHQNVRNGTGYHDEYRDLYFSGGDHYGADGIHVRDSGRNLAKFVEIQSFEGPGYYGDYGYHGYDINIIDNKVNTTGDDGIEVVDSGSTLVDGNRIKNVGVTKVKEVYEDYGYEEGYYGYGDTSLRTGADEYGADAIHVRGVHNSIFGPFPGLEGEYGFQPYAVVVSNNNIDNVSDDGIEVLDSGRTRIEHNDIYNVGLKGFKYITQGYGEYEDTFKMKFSGGDYYGADGIHVRNVFADDFLFPVLAYDEEVVPVYPYFDYGYAVEIIDNNIDKTGDDGIEVVRSGRTLIDSNDIYNVGVNALDEGYGYKKGKMSHDGFGADGIHVREVIGPVHIYGDYEGMALPGFGVEITNNFIDNTADDGIQVLWSGNTLIDNNEILNVGKVVEDYLDEAGEYGYGVHKLLTRLQDDHGADGIHVHTGFFKNGLPGYEGSEDAKISEEGYGYDYDPYFLSTYVEITNNTIGSIDEETGETSQGPSDDGIETEGVTSLLIADNNVYDAGDDGIKVIGYAGFFANEVELPEEEVILFGGGEGPSPEFNVVIERNTVIDSGTPGEEGGEEEEAFESKSYGYEEYHTYGVDYDGQPHGDGIEITGYDRADVFDNVVTNSIENGLYVSGPFNARFETNVLGELAPDARRIKVAGNIFTNNRIGANFESGLIDLTGAPNQFIGGDDSEIGLLFKPFDFATLEDEYYYEDYGFQKVTPRDFGAWQGWPLHTYVPTEGYADLALLDVDGAGSTPFDPEVIPTNFGGTIGSQIFRGFQEDGDFFVALDNFAFFDQEAGLPIWQNALNSNFETPFGNITPSATGGILSLDVFNFLEEKFFHFPDRGDIGIFFFGFVPTDLDQERIFEEFDPFNAGLSGLNVTITGLPPINLDTAAVLAGIAPAAGGEEGEDLANIEPAAGGEEAGCLGDVIGLASTGTPASINWGGTVEELLSGAAGCGSETF